MRAYPGRNPARPALVALAAALGLLQAGAAAVPAEPPGAITGWAEEAAGRPGTVAPPRPGLPVLALRRDPALVARLQALKNGSRDSLEAYRRAIANMRRTVEEHVRGRPGADGRHDGTQGGDVHTTLTDAAGRFAFTGLGPGEWLVLAWAVAQVDRAGRDAVKDRGGFLPQKRLAGYDLVTVWLLEVAVRPGETTAVQLTGRNEWFSGVEERMVPRPQGPSTGGSRRRSGL